MASAQADLEALSLTDAGGATYAVGAELRSEDGHRVARNACGAMKLRSAIKQAAWDVAHGPGRCVAAPIVVPHDHPAIGRTVAQLVDYCDGLRGVAVLLLESIGAIPCAESDRSFDVESLDVAA